MDSINKQTIKLFPQYSVYCCNSKKAKSNVDTRGLFLESRELSGPEMPVVAKQSTCFRKLIFTHVFNVRKTKRIAKFDTLEPQRYEDVKAIVELEISPKNFGTFEKQANAPWCGRYCTHAQNHINRSCKGTMDSCFGLVRPHQLGITDKPLIQQLHTTNVLAVVGKVYLDFRVDSSKLNNSG